MEKVKFKVSVINNILEIIPDDKIKDNSVYEFRFKDIGAIDGQTLSTTFKLFTKLSPLYVDVQSVRVLIDNIPIEDTTILYHIREASRYADYLKSSIKQDNIPFEVTQFVRYKAAHDCILSFSVRLASSTGYKGTVSKVSFEEKETTRDISKLLDHLCKELKGWEDALKGYKNEGRAKMQVANRGSKSSPYFSAFGADLKRGIAENDG